MHKKILALFMVISITFSSSACKEVKEYTENFSKDDMQKAKKDPFEKYPEEIEYTLGKLSNKDQSNMPKNDTYENNAYTRYLKDKLNIQNKDVFEANEDTYKAYVDKAEASKKLPDVMLVSDMEQLKRLVKNDLIEDLTTAYNDCMSERIKDIYKSYGDDIINSITFDNKIMAIPETNIEDGPNFIWLRKDWMDELKLKAPENLTDVENIIAEFQKNKPGNVGLVCSQDIIGDAGYSYEYELDIIFAYYNSFPKHWVKDKDGNLVYGSIQSETKTALEHVRKLYKDKVLDNYFLMRNSDAIINLIESGKCGAFFGPWWAPNNPLMSAREKDSNMNWQPYLIPTVSDGTTKYFTHNPTSKYVVVRKGYEHPELVCKELSVMFDYLRYQEKNVEEFDKYYQDNVDPTARPISINIDYKKALSNCYNSLNEALNNKGDVSKLGILENAYYQSCNKYLKDPKNASGEEWAAYNSRIVTARLLENAKLVEEPSLYFIETSSMTSKWWKLKELEKQAFYKIITSEEDISYFDKFTQEWYNQGGKEIEKEVRDEVAKKKN